MSDNVANAVLWYLMFLFSTVCHEAAHAWSAFKLGDDTAFKAGQMSLDPWPHIRRSPIGMIVVPLVTWFSAGWLMGWASAPYDPQWARRFPKRSALMALAGPTANLCLLTGAALLMRLGLEWHAFTPAFLLNASHLVEAPDGWLVFAAHALSILFSLNLLLFIFNLIPVPPLDGSYLPILLLPERAAAWYSSVRRSPILCALGLLLIFKGVGPVFTPALSSLANLLFLNLKPA